MTTLFQDLRFAFRSFRKTPIFSVVSVLSLALGIGANTAIFTLVDQLILRLLPVKDPQSIVLLNAMGDHYGGNNGRNAISYPMYQDFRDRNQVFNQMMCRYSINLAVGVSGQTEVVSGELVSGNYFPLLGVGAALGRVFTANDDLNAGAHPYAVLSYAYWKSRFAGDPGVIGQTIRVNNFPLTIIGVSQPGFDGMEPGLPTQIRIPITMAPVIRPDFTNMYNRRQRWVNVYGRLKPGVSLGQAQAGMQPLFHQIIEMEVRQPPFRNATSFNKQQFLKMWIRAMPGSQGNTNLRRQYERPLWVLTGVVGLVLLIACANLASLLTARAASRQKEIAIRLAVGASRARMMRQLITESLFLGMISGAAGIGLAMLMVKGLLRFLPGNISGYAISSSPDLRVLVFTFLLALLTGLLFGLIPALQSTNPDIAPTLKAQAGNGMGGRAQVGFRKVLVSSQVMLSLLLLIGAGLFIRSLGNLQSLDPGFHAGNLIQFEISPRSTGYTVEAARAFNKLLEERLRAMPGVRAAGFANVGILTGSEWDQGVTIEGYTATPGEDMSPHFNAVTSGYFDALGMRLIAGRFFTIKDDRNSPPVAVVNESFVKRYFGKASPIGRHIGLGTDPGTRTDTQIVGVVNDTRYEGLREEIPRQIIMCSSQLPNTSYVVYVRTVRDPDNAFHSVRQLVHSLDPNLPVVRMKTMDRQMEESLVTERMIATLSSVFGLLATVLAVIGLYGVMAYMVTRRSREIGIRMALGALSGDVVYLVMREVLGLVAAGLLVGLPTAYLLTRMVQTQLYGIEANDPLSIVLATSLLTFVALAAGYIPARRAASFDPVRVLRYE